MPRKKSLIAEVAPPPEASLLLEVPFVLSLEERTALRGMLTHPVFKKALHNARLKAPGVFTGAMVPAILDGTTGSIAANNRLHEMRGWRMFELALGRQVEDPRLPKPEVKDDYMRDR